MARYFMTLSYRGAPFHGWQSQPNAISVQQTIETALQTILRHPVAITGAGRTDTGVNARMMIAHFDTDSPIITSPQTLHSLNTLVGRDIAIGSIAPVHETAHARFDAISRTYRYYTSSHKSPFFHSLAWQEPPRGLDFQAMNRAASLLLSVNDFTSFSKLHTDVKTNLCNVTQAQWEETPGGHLFTITANRFLRNMVRAIVGTLVDVGRGKTSIEQFRQIIAANNRCEAGTSMPAHALYLWDIKYPYNF